MTLNVIDSHFHIWDPDAQDLPWLAGLPSLQHKYTIEDLAAQYAKFGVNFLGGVYVEVDAADHELEDRLLYENASPLILKRMLQGRVSPWMRVPINADGIREPLHVDSEPRGRALEPEFIAGLRVMAVKGMPFELCNRGPELGDMAKAFSQVPEVTVIIDHLGNAPGLDEESCAALAALAELPNSYIKVSGDNSCWTRSARTRTSSKTTPAALTTSTKPKPPLMRGLSSAGRLGERPQTRCRLCGTPIP